MANKDTSGGTSPSQLFAEEIDYNDIEKLEIVGKGSFGTVYKGRWKNQFVAVKHIDAAAERKTFSQEIRQMSRVCHPNIVKLYGACTRNPVCLVMEYAEGGSLYNVLHGRPESEYNAGHAISWVLQCAKGVAYLHNMKPKALIHRDLKPPNLLLENDGRLLKICDFGTACDLKTYMTNNKGSAAWMAPEVFEGSNYTEKCDVFSWGVILWQVLSRQKPFNDIGNNALRIMWSVHQGKRPQLIEGCPPPLETLMTRCWAKDVNDRPSMNEIVDIISILFQFFSGYDEPIKYVAETSYEEDFYEEDATDDFSIDGFTDSYVKNPQNSIGGTSAVCNNNSQLSIPLNIKVDDGLSEHYSQLPDDILRQIPFERQNESTNSLTDSNTHEDIDKIYLMLDPQMRPVEPDRSCQQSVNIFEDHKKLATEYFKVQTEIAYMLRKRQELSESLSQAESAAADTEAQDDEIKTLEKEKDSLIQFYDTLKRQLEMIESKNNDKGRGCSKDPSTCSSSRSSAHSQPEIP